MLVLKSYDETAFKAPNSSPRANNLEIKETSGFFIVNDPGTRRGENYHYAFKSIMDAMHDWNPDNILNGQKAVVVFD